MALKQFFDVYREQNPSQIEIIENIVYNGIDQNDFHFVDFAFRAGGVALDTGVYLPTEMLNFNSFQFANSLFVILHETGHYRRMKRGITSITELASLVHQPAFDALVIREEDAANDYAVETLRQIADATNNPIFNKAAERGNERAGDRQVNMARQVYLFVESLKGQYPDPSDCVLKIIKGEIRMQENVFLNKFKNLVHNFISKNIISESPEVLPAQPKVKPDVKPAPAPAQPRPGRDWGRKIHPGAKPAPKASNNKSVDESPEVLPAQPKVKPDVKPAPAPAQPRPGRDWGRKIHPGAKPAPKAQFKRRVTTSINEIHSYVLALKKINDRRNFLRLISEDEMKNADNKRHGNVDPQIRQNIEQKKDHPFSDIDFLHRSTDDQNDKNYNTIQKLGDEEYKDVTASVDRYGIMNPAETMEILQRLKVTENNNKEKLEKLSKDTVQKYFGIPDEVMSKIFVELKQPGTIDKSDFDNDDSEGGGGGVSLDDVKDQFTPEEIELIKQHSKKRVFSNALMMGAGFRAHNLLAKIKPELDAIDKNLYFIYSKIMSNTAKSFWQHAPIKGIQGLMLGGKSKLTYEEQENEENPENQDDNNPGPDNQDNAPEGNEENHSVVSGAIAEAVVFPVLLHETVKAVMEYIFAAGLPQFDERINKAIMKNSEKFHFEHWHKLLGPRLWKYFHDAVDFIVKDRGNDYRIVAYLLDDISKLPPNKFLFLMDKVLHDGNRAIEILTQILDNIEEDIANNPEGHSIAPDLGNVQGMMGQINALLGQPEQPQPQDKHKPFNEMTPEELQNYIDWAIDNSLFEKAAEANDELEKRT